MDLQPDSQLGQYRIVRELGHGGMGQVYEVEHRVLDKRFALKLLPRDFCKRPDSIARFEREAKVMAKLEHPNIVKVDEFGETGERYWLRMELVNGLKSGVVTLRELAEQRGGKLDQDEYLPILRQILEALAYAHDKGVVHRDLKPANILLEGNAKSGIKVKVSDFGLARVIGEDFIRTQAHLSVAQSMNGEARPEEDVSDGKTTAIPQGTTTKALLGTWEYMSPEQKEPGRDVDARSDIFSLGLMSFRLLTGEEPGLETPSQVVKGLRPQWDDFIKKALKKDPSQRYANGQAMLDALVQSFGSGFLTSPRSYRITARVWVPVVALAACLAAWQFWPAHKERVEHPPNQPSEPARLVMTRGSLAVTSEPTNAMVGLGGLALKQTPASFEGVKSGKYNLRLTLPGYETTNLDVSIPAEDFTNIGTINLIRSVGSLELSSTPEGSDYELRGGEIQILRGTTPTTLSNLPTGDYSYILKRPDWEQSNTVAIKRNETSRVAVDFPYGNVKVTSIPEGASVLAAGKEVGKTPYYQPQIRPASLVSYTLRLARHKDANVTGKVEPKKELALNAALEKRPGSVWLDSSPLGAQVFEAGKELGITPLRWNDVPAGPHELTVKLEGFVPVVTNLTVEPEAVLDLGRLELALGPDAGEFVATSASNLARHRAEAGNLFSALFLRDYHRHAAHPAEAEQYAKTFNQLLTRETNLLNAGMVRGYRSAKLAAASEDAFNLCLLGDCEFYGVGTAVNSQAAAVHFRQAAEKGSAGGQYMLALSYLTGKGLQQNTAEAISWFDKALAQGLVLSANTVEYSEFNKRKTRVTDGLWNAVETHSLDEAKNALTQGADVNSTNANGLSLIEHALVNARETRGYEIVQSLIKKGATVDAKSNLGMILLALAVYHGDAAQVETLLSKGTPVNFALQLWKADYQPKVELGDVMSNTTWNKTPLMLAAKNPDIQTRTNIIRRLIEKGAAVNARTDYYEETPLMHEANNHCDPIAIRLLLDSGANVDATNRFQQTALMIACRGESDHSPGITCLVKSGAKINAKDQNGKTPLHFACAQFRPVKKVVQCLLDNGAGVKALNNSQDSPLNQIFLLNDENLEVIKLLIERGCDVSVPDWRGQTAIYWAAGGHQVEIVDLLLKSGANIEAQDQDGRTPLLNAVANGAASGADKKLKTVKLLLSKRANVAARDKEGKTCLSLAEHFAVPGAWFYDEAMELVNLLKKAGATH